MSSFPRPSTRESTGGYVCDWIETFCRLGQGDGYGEPIVLQPFQREFLRQLYEVNADGTRHYTRATLGVPKGAGKTQLAACVAAFELCGGVHVSPLVAVAATSFEQSDLLFSDLKAICTQSPDLAAITTVLDTEVLLRNEPGRAYRVAAVGGVNDGARPTAVICDEVHELVGSKTRMHLVLSNGAAKRKGGYVLNISTAGWDPESLLGTIYDHGVKVNTGELDDPQCLFVWYQADPDIEPKTRDEWREAILSCNPAADVFMDLESMVSRAMELPLFESKRYMLNVWSAQETQWEVAGLWPGLKSDLQLDPDKPLWAAADVGVVHDSSAVVWAQKIGEKYVLRSKIWANPNPVGSTAYQRWRFELAEIEDFIRELAQKFPRPAMRDAGGRSLRGPAIYYDPNRFLRSAQALTAEGLNLIEWPQSLSRLVPAAQCMFELVKDGNVAHDGDPALLSHVRNVVARQTPRGWRIDKPSHSPRNIDGALATAMVLWEASKQEPPAIEPRIRLMNLGIEDED